MYLLLAIGKLYRFTGIFHPHAQQCFLLATRLELGLELGLVLGRFVPRSLQQHPWLLPILD